MGTRHDDPVLSRQTGALERVTCPAAFVFIGARPHTGWLPQDIGLAS